MKTIKTFSIIIWKAMALLMLLLINNVSKAQLNEFECYIDSSYFTGSLVSVAKLTATSINGKVLILDR